MAESKPAAAVRSKLDAAYGKARAPAAEQPAHPAGTLDQVVRDHADQVRRIARYYARRTNGAVEMDDLASVGVIGLIDAYHRYDPAGGREFGVYAEFRIKGAILDELRRLDPMSQPQRRRMRALDVAVNELATELGREPSEGELAQHLGKPLAEVQRLRRDVQEIRFVSAEDSDIPDIRVDLSGTRLDRTQLRLMLRQALEQLVERDQQVLGLYYLHDLSLKEIGVAFGVTEARVSQLHKQAVLNLRAVLEREGAF